MDNKNLILKKIPNYFLKPGELKFFNKPVTVSTILGSCISVTMYSKLMKSGAICHAILCNKEDNEKFNFKYVNDSLNFMLKKFIKINVPLNSLEIKLFGGSDMFKTKGKITVGKQNISEAKRILNGYGLKIISEDTGGNLGRKLFFSIENGNVYVKKIRKSNS